MATLRLICYFDYIVLIAATTTGLQRLLDCLSDVLGSHWWEVNVDKSKHLLFKSNIFWTPQCFVTLKGKNLIRVSAYKHLDVMLSKNFTVQDDVDRLKEIFLQQFNSIFQQILLRSLYFLFKTHVMHFMAWSIYMIACIHHFRRASISSHKAVKRKSGFTMYGIQTMMLVRGWGSYFSAFSGITCANHDIYECESPWTAMLSFFWDLIRK